MSKSVDRMAANISARLSGKATPATAPGKEAVRRKASSSSTPSKESISKKAK